MHFEMELLGAKSEENHMKNNNKKFLNIFVLSVGIILIFQYMASAAGPNGGGSPGGVSNNLQLWLKADSGTDTTTNNAEVTSWDDQSPNAWTADNSVDSKPIYQTNAINFNPALSFGLTGRSELSINNGYPQSPPGSSGLTIFTVFKPISDNTHINFILDVGRMTGDGYGVMASLGTYSGYNSTTNSGGTGTGTIPLFGQSLGEVPALLTHEVQFGTGRTAYLNGEPISTTVNLILNRLDNNNIDFSANHQTSSGPLTIGRQAKDGNITNANGRYFRGNIAEVIIYTADISGTDKIRVESYLAVKYGITLIDTINYLAPDGTVVYDSLGSHSGYTNDIAGIGVDDDSGLVQPASRSINSDSIVTVTGDSGSMSSGEYFIWGNDDGALTPSSEVPASAPAMERLTRVWRGAETGDVGNVSISFDLNSVGGGIVFNYPAAFVLLIDDDGDFTNAAFITGATVNGQIVTFDNVDFNDGDYFTITYPTSPPVFYNFIPAVFKP